MLRGKIRRCLRLLLWCLGITIIAHSQAFGSIPATGSGTIPLCPPKSSLEMQVSGSKEKEPTLSFSFSDTRPHLTAPPGAAGAAETTPGTSSEVTTHFQLAPVAELRVSFLYNQDKTPGQSPLTPVSHLLFRYSMDYCIMPHLKVGISGYLYKPTSPGFVWRNHPGLGDSLYGFGPGIKYDLGRWSFLLRTQLEPGNKDRGEALHNWFRVWYAF